MSSAGVRPPAAPAGDGPADAAAPAHGSTRPPLRGAHWGPVRREVVKLLFQRRSYLIWAGAAGIPFLVSLAFHLSGSDPGEGGLAFIGRVTENGMYVPLLSLMMLTPFMLPLAAAMVAGYMVSGEAELGTLRIVLLRPVRRGALLLAKWAAGILYLLAAAALMLGSGLLFGGLFFGLHPMVTLSGSTVGIAHGFGLTLLAYVYGMAAMACIMSLALLASSITDSSLTALIAAIAVYIVIQVLISFSYFDWLRPWVFPSYFEEYVSFFRDPIDWRPILKGFGVFAAWSGGLTVLAWLVFRRKDVLS